jgi:hypothetical protein
MTERVPSRVLYLKAISNIQEGRAAQTVTFQNKLRYHRKFCTWYTLNTIIALWGRHSVCTDTRQRAFVVVKLMFLSTWHYKRQLTGNVLPSSGLVRQHLLCVLFCPDEVGLVLLQSNGQCDFRFLRVKWHSKTSEGSYISKVEVDVDLVV